MLSPATKKMLRHVAWRLQEQISIGVPGGPTCDKARLGLSFGSGFRLSFRLGLSLGLVLGS